ncbi:hypothetical protein [Aeromonas salmonicida]
MSRFFFFLLALFSASSPAFQLADAMIDAEVRKVNNFVSADSNGIKVNVIGKGYKGNAAFFQTNTVVPKATFTSHIKSSIGSLYKRNAFYAGWFATMAAAGWAIDELHNQMSVTKNIFKGYCNNKAPIVTVEECAKSITPPFDNMKYSTHYATTPTPQQNAGVATTFYKVRFVPINGTTGWMEKDFSMSWKGLHADTQPVTDDQLYESMITRMLQDPVKAADAFMQPGTFPFPYPQLFPDPLKYIPGVSEADYPLLDCYFKGNLQSSNPAGPCYAPESEYQRITTLGENIKQGNTVTGQVGEMNDTLKDPLTQAQLEESLNKLKDSDVSKITDDASKIYDEGFKQINDSILADSLPGMPDIIPIPQFHTGTCRSIPINFSLVGVNVTKYFPGETGCAQFEKMKEFLGWLMAVGVVIGLMFAALREAN